MKGSYSVFFTKLAALAVKNVRAIPFPALPLCAVYYEMSLTLGALSMKGPHFFKSALLITAICTSLGAVNADDNTDERERGRREVTPYFNKQVTVRVALVRSSGPEWTERLFNTRLFGCPNSPLAPAEPTKDIIFTTAGPGPWAGAVDGINTAITTQDGTRGGGFAIPSNSTARLSEDMKGPELEFSFDATLNLRRALVDAAAAEFDRCFSALPPGSYSSERLMELCPYRPVTRDQQKQSCVTSLRGLVGQPLADGNGFNATLTESTVCDFVGYGRRGDTNTAFTTCYFNEYQGVATIASEVQAASPRVQQLRAAKKRMMKVCAKSKRGRAMRSARVKACVMREMAKVMAGA
jgi:hypothetical protein